MYMITHAIIEHSFFDCMYIFLT